MTWQQLLNAREVQVHATSKQELDDLRSVIARDLHDAGLAGLSADRSFATSYNAALQAARMVIACAGYRVTAQKGHHRVTFQGAELALGPRAAKLVAYLETCRMKRNAVDYDLADVVSDGEAAELLRKARQLVREAERWIARHHPALAASRPR